jgi:hypothetical protein
VAPTKPKFRKKVTTFAQVSEDMAVIDAHMRDLGQTFNKLATLLNKLRGIDFRDVRRDHPSNGGPDTGTAPKPGKWPP